ncbi:Uncharacterised protein [Mycoplasmopsis maculosa]|uniref:Uncharacterized protein n=1 Tax=Mycoplasmopsis maculosa TaxID=114885 RepID=A0A449B3Y8_9BACT|nr:hypothetical protein [Mycoplasmopsis maculosa]VEU75296.1 Uncharacterised protein [Mycoplasmopsis maculosa]
MKKIKLLPILSVPLAAAPLVSLYDYEFDKMYYAEHIVTISDIQKLFKELFQDNFIANSYNPRYYGHSSYRLINNKKYVSNSNLSGNWFNKNGQINLNNLDNINNLSFNSFYSQFKNELNQFEVNEQDIFNVFSIYRNKKNELNFNNIEELKSKVKTETINVTIDKLENNNLFKFDDDFYYEYDEYTIRYENDNSSLEYAEFSGENDYYYNALNDEEDLLKSGHLVINNDEFWPSIEYLKLSDFKISKTDDDFYFLKTKIDEQEYLNNKLSSLYKLNLYYEIKPYLSKYRNKFLVSSTNKIFLDVNNNIPTFRTEISYIDEIDIKDFLLSKYLNKKEVKNINENYIYEVEYDDYAEFIVNLGKNYTSMSIFNKLIQNFNDRNIKMIYDNQNPYFEANFENKKLKIYLKIKPNSTINDSFWWNRFNIVVPKYNSNNATQKLFSLNVSVPADDSQNINNQYNISVLEKPNKTFFSQARIFLNLSNKRNEELIINDNIVPIGLTGFIYNINPTDKKMKIQIKVYDVDSDNNILDTYKVFTISDNLFSDIGIENVYDEINFKLHSWNPKQNLEQAQKINPYIIDENFKEVSDKDGNLIKNPEYDFKINPNTGTYESIWTLNKAFYENISDFVVWPKINKLESENKILEYFANENDSIIVKTIFADNGLKLDFSQGFTEINGYYLGNDINSLGNSFTKFSLPTDKDKILYFTAPFSEGWYLLSAIQKTGLAKYYLIYQTNEKFKNNSQENVLDNSFLNLKNQNKVNNLINSKYFYSFRDYVKAQSLDIQNLSYSDLIIQYENFLLFNNLSFNVYFDNLKQNDFINDFENYLISNNKFGDTKPTLNEFKELLFNFINSKMNNDKNQKNIYSYIETKPIDNLEPQKFDYLNNENDKNLIIIKPDEDLNIYNFKFNYNIDPSTTIVNFIKNKESYNVDLTEWLYKNGYRINFPLELIFNENKLIELISKKTINDWLKNESLLKEIVKENITHFKIFNKEIDINNETFEINGKNINITELLSLLKNISFSFSEKGIFINIFGKYEINGEKFIINSSDLNLKIDWPIYSSPFSSFKINNLKYDNFNLEKIKNELNKNNLFSNQNYETTIEDVLYEFILEYLNDFKIDNIYSDIDLLVTSEYTKYLTDEELLDEEKIKKITKNLVLNKISNDYVLNKIIDEIKAKKLINSSEIDFNIDKKELKSKLKQILNSKYDELNNKYSKLSEIINYWIDKDKIIFSISNHKISKYNEDISELLKDFNNLKFVLEDKEANFNWNNINNFFEYKKRLLKIIKNNLDKYRFNLKSLEKYQEWINYYDSLGNGFKKEILYILWTFFDKEAAKISKNKTEEIKLFSHFFPKENINNIIENFLIKQNYSLNAEKINNNEIFNNLLIKNKEKFLSYTKDIVLISPIESITGEKNISAISILNIEIDKLIDNSNKSNNDNSSDNNDSNNSNNDNINTQNNDESKINLSSFYFNDISIFLNQNDSTSYKDKIITKIIENILNVFDFNQEQKAELLKNINLPTFNDAFFKDILVKSNNLAILEEKEYYKNSKNISFKANLNSKKFIGENNFNLNIYLNKDFDLDYEEKLKEKTKIIWISTLVLALILTSGIITTVIVLNKKQRKVKII